MRSRNIWRSKNKTIIEFDWDNLKTWNLLEKFVSSEEVGKGINDIVEDEMRGCVLCSSQVDLVYCQGIESIATGRNLGLLCFSCRQEYSFTDAGILDEKAINEALQESWENVDDWDENDGS